MVTPSREAGSSRIMFIASQSEPKEQVIRSKRTKAEPQLILGFSNDDKVGTFQPHNDTLVVTFRIGGFDVRRVLVD